MQCLFCGANFQNQDAYQLHLGIGAPAFHLCWNDTEMANKGMVRNGQGEWAIDPTLVVHWRGWASLKSSWHPDHLPIVLTAENESGS